MGKLLPIAVIVSMILVSNARAHDDNSVGIAETMTTTAQALLASTRGDVTFSEALVSYSMEEELLKPFDSELRHDWSYWPTFRHGLDFSLMHANQRALTQELLWSALSAEGYFKVVNIMQLENQLAPVANTGFPRGMEDYHTVLFGEPSMETPWAWRFEGHHLSLNVSVVDGAVSVTPTFLGADPATVRDGMLAGFRVLRVEEDLGWRLINALDSDQQKKAMVAFDPAFNDAIKPFDLGLPEDIPWDIMSSNILKAPDQWDAWQALLEPDGISTTDMNDQQRRILQNLVHAVVSLYRPEIAEAYLDEITLDELSFAWIGSTEAGEPHYFRIEGPDFVFEFDNVQSGANHIHQVWRSRSGDFGAALLKRHYEEAH